MKNEQEPHWVWDYYQACQYKASRTSNEAEEEKLNYLVTLFLGYKVPETSQELDRFIDNHLAGDRQKARRRKVLLERYLQPEAECDGTDHITLKEWVQAIREMVTPAQWEVLDGVANGLSYQELSAVTKVPVGTLKSTVSRIRKMVRETLRARLVGCALDVLN